MYCIQIACKSQSCLPPNTPLQGMMTSNSTANNVAPTIYSSSRWSPCAHLVKLQLCLPTYGGLGQLAISLQQSSEDVGTQTLTARTPVNMYYYYKHLHLVLGNACKGTHTGRVNRHNKRGTWTIMLAHHLESVMFYKRQWKMCANHI